MRAAISIQSREPLTGLDHVRSHVLSDLGGGKQIVFARGMTLDTLLSNHSLSNRIQFLANNLPCRIETIIEYGFF